MHFSSKLSRILRQFDEENMRRTRCDCVRERRKEEKLFSLNVSAYVTSGVLKDFIAARRFPPKIKLETFLPLEAH